MNRRLTELFEEAVILGSSGRAALVARVRADDAALADELAALLAAEARAVTALEPRTADERPPGRHGIITIPGYRIDDVIGEGGMGTVYAAEQAEPRRRVAIKVLHARSHIALARFRNEAQIMARLDHPGIARVLESGDADGHPFLVMEFVEGETLDHHARALPLVRKLELFAAICDAVHHAHLKGVVHRDLKPANVMVKPDGRVVVLDFGVGRLAEDGAPTATRAGELVGTPAYMSPEQAMLRADQVDARTDVYTLGVMLYQLACGKLPYSEGPIPIVMLAAAIIEEEPVLLGKRDPALRGDLEAIASKALAKEPAARYQSAAALADDVRSLLHGDSVSVRVPGALERAARYARRRPIVAATLAGAAIATGVFSGVVTALWLDARASRQVAEEARGRAEHARADLEARSNQLVLRQARAALARDPTEALAWLRTLTSRGVDAGAAWAIVDEALARGVARDVRRGHTDEVHWVEAFHAGQEAGAERSMTRGRDGFVSGGYDGRAIAWTPEPHVLYTSPRGRVHAVRPSPDGTRFAIGGDDGALHVASGGTVIELAGHAGDVQHMAWSFDGRWLATGDDHGNVWVWPRGEAPGRALAHGATAIGDVAFAEHGAALVAGTHDGTIWLWGSPDAPPIVTSAGADVVTAWTDGARVVAVDGDGAVHAWHAQGADLVAEAVVATGLKTKRAVFATGGAWALLGGIGGGVTRVEGSTVEKLWTYRSQVRSLAISPDGRTIAAGSDDGELELHDRISGRHVVLRGHGARVRHVAFAGGTLLSSDSEGAVRTWDLAAMPPALLDAGAPVARMVADDSGTHVATVDDRGEVVLWTLADGGRRRLGRVEGRATAIAFAGATVVTGTAEGHVAFWTEPSVQRVVKGSVKAIRASSERVAIATSAGPIVQLTPTGGPLPALAGNRGGTEAIAMAGDLIASGGQDRVIRLWRREPVELDGPRGDTHFVEADGELVVTAGNDGQVLAWLAGARRLVAQHTGAVTALAVTRTWIVSAGRDATIARAPRAGGAAESVELGSAAVALAVEDDGTVHAVTRAGEVVRWGRGDAIVEIEHGALGALALTAGRWIVAFDDGALVVQALRARSYGELQNSVAASTTYSLH
jgi:WD40 repeat protein/predicted Ser/Thr protein kinase